MDIARLFNFNFEVLFVEQYFKWVLAIKTNRASNIYKLPRYNNRKRKGLKHQNLTVPQIAQVLVKNPYSHHVR